MTRFVQIHALTAYPLSNPNRDDTGRPKTASFGGSPRLRISSQAMKRAIRVSPVFREQLDGNLGERTQRIGDAIEAALPDIDPKVRSEIVQSIVSVFGKVDTDRMKKKNRIHTRQLAFISPQEKEKAIAMARAAAAGEDLPTDKSLASAILQTADTAVDVAMFGRMLADSPQFNREAAVQVSHAFTTHRALVEDDYYTAVDDNKTDEEDAGAGFVGEAGFGSGVFYLYVCIDRDLLERNLDGDEVLASKAIEALVCALAVSTPSGKRASFANHTRANYLLVEKGGQQPRSLAEGFMKPVRGEDLVGASVEALRIHRDNLQRAYGPSADGSLEMNINDGQSASLADVGRWAAA